MKNKENLYASIPYVDKKVSRIFAGTAFSGIPDAYKDSFVMAVFVKVPSSLLTALFIMHVELPKLLIVTNIIVDKIKDKNFVFTAC